MVICLTNSTSAVAKIGVEPSKYMKFFPYFLVISVKYPLMPYIASPIRFPTTGRGSGPLKLFFLYCRNRTNHEFKLEVNIA